MDTRARTATTVVTTIAAAPVSYIVQRTLGAWGILDGVSDALGRYLKVHVSPAAAGWTIALLFTLALYIFALWVIWHKHGSPNQPVNSSTTPIPGGSDNTLVGEVSPLFAAGNRNTVIGAIDASGNTILNKGGVAIGAGAVADPTSTAIGSGASAGTLPVANDRNDVERIYFLKNLQAALEKAKPELPVVIERIFETYKTYNTPEWRMGRTNWTGSHQSNFRAVRDEIARIATDVFGEQRTLGHHPNYDRNPGIKADRDDEILDEEQRYNYRRDFDIYREAQALLRATEVELTRQIKALEDRISERNRKGYSGG